MNLIEMLGGYESAKDVVDKAPGSTYTYHNHPYQKGYIRCWGGDGKEYFLASDIEKALLEYRREHSIFEVGDKVVKTNSKIKHAHIRVVIGTSPSGGAVLDYQGFPYKYPYIRHATDEEIKAGHRL